MTQKSEMMSYVATFTVSAIRFLLETGRYVEIESHEYVVWKWDL